MGLNRKLRRQMAKGMSDADAVEYLRRKQQETAKQTQDIALDYYFTLMALALHDEFGFGVGRIKRVNDRMNRDSECIVKGNISFDDIKKFVGNGFKEVSR